MAALQEAVVVIEGTGGNGTGFNISEDGLIVTNRHVVEDSRIITIRFGGDGAATFTTREWIDIPEVDMALIDIDGEDLPFVELNDEYPSADDEIIFIGNPLGYDWTISEAVSYTHLEDIDAILVTHEHSDHINRVAQLSKKYHIPVYASELTWESLPFYDDYFRWERHIFDYGMEIGDIGLDFFRLDVYKRQPLPYGALEKWLNSPAFHAGIQGFESPTRHQNALIMAFCFFNKGRGFVSRPRFYFSRV